MSNDIEQKYKLLSQVSWEMFQNIESMFVQGKFRPDMYADYRDRLEDAGVETYGFKTEVDENKKSCPFCGGTKDSHSSNCYLTLLNSKLRDKFISFGMDVPESNCISEEQLDEAWNKRTGNMQNIKYQKELERVAKDMLAIIQVLEKDYKQHINPNPCGPLIMPLPSECCKEDLRNLGVDLDG